MPCVPPVTFAFISAFAFSCMDAELGYLINIAKLPILELVSFRQGCVVLLCGAYILLTKTLHAPCAPPAIRKWIWIRLIFLTINVLMGYHSLERLTISEFLSLFSLMPLIMGVLCWLFLGEPFSTVQAVCCHISLLGVAMITDPLGHPLPSGPESHLEHRGINDNISNLLTSKLIGGAMCLTAVVCLSAEMTLMRIIKDQTTMPQILTIISLGPSTTAALIMAGTQTAPVLPPTPIAWAVIIVLTPTGFIAQAALTYASQRASGLQVSLAQYTNVGCPRSAPAADWALLKLDQVVWGTTLQWLLYGNFPSPLAFLGMINIVAAGLYATVYGTERAPGEEPEPEDYELFNAAQRGYAPLARPTGQCSPGEVASPRCSVSTDDSRRSGGQEEV